MSKKRKKLMLRSLSLIFLCMWCLFIGAVSTSAENPHSARVSNEMTYLLNYSDGTQIESKNINEKMPHDIVDLKSVSIVMKSTVVETPAANWMDPYGDFINLSSSEYGNETTYFSFESLPKIITNMNTDYFTMEYSRDGILYSKNEPQIGELKAFRVKPRNTTEILPVGEELLIHFDMKLDTDQLIKSDLLANKTEENPYGNVFYPFTGEGNWILSERFPISFTGETKVEVKYVDVDSNEEIATNEIITGVIGKGYETTEKTIDGYEFVKADGEAKGKFGKNNKEVTYVYKKVKEQEISIIQKLGSVVENGDAFENGPISNWQFTLGKENPEFTVFDDEALKKEKPLRPRKSPYTYYGYSIRYGDNSYELRQDRKLDFNELKKHEKEIGKNISLITIVYGPTSTITANYNLVKEDGTKQTLLSEEEYGKFDIAYPNLFDVVGESFSLNTIVNNYIPINFDGAKQVKFTDDDQVIDIDFRMPKITINYQDNLGKELKESQVSYGKIKEILNIDIPQIDGYDYTKNVNKEISYSGEDQEITLIYTPKIKGTVTVRFINESGKELAEEESRTGEVGKPYATEPKKIEGYELVKSPENQSGTFSEENIEVVYEYKTVKEQELYVHQEIGSVRYDNNEKVWVSTGHSNYQFRLNQTNPAFVVSSDEELKNETPLYPGHTPYTYYGYSIEYKDKSFELVKDRTLVYKDLIEHGKEIGKEIDLITVYYGPTSTIKVNYNLVKEDGTRQTLLSEEGYGKFDVNYPDLFDVIGESFSLNRVINDYIPINFDGAKEVKFTDDDQVIDIDFRMPKITIKYQDTLGKVLKESQVSYGKIKDILNIDIPQIDGYDYTKNVNKEISYSGEDQEITLIYSPKVEGTVTVRYLDELGKEIAQRVTTTNYVGEEYNAVAKDIPGYELLLTPDNTSGTYQEGVITVDYIYHNNMVIPDIEGQVIVKYVDETNEEIASRTELSGSVGEVYETSAKAIAGYELISEAEMSGQFTEGVTELVYQYKSTNTPVDVEGKVLVNYVDEEGQSIAASVELTGVVNTNYQTSPKDISGYVLKSDSGNTVGHFIEGVQQVTYVYEKTDDGKPDIEGFVTVFYVDKNNKEIADRTSLSGTVGTGYTTSAKELTGYELIETPTNATGNFSEGVQNVVYVYQKDNIPEPYVEGNIITKYVTEEGKEIALPEMLTGEVGTNYLTKTKDIPGFELTKEPDNKS